MSSIIIILLGISTGMVLRECFERLKERRAIKKYKRTK
jgi:hypothetical protein